MNNPSIVFKGIPNGLLIILDDEIPFDLLKDLFSKKVIDSKDLLEEATLYIKFEKRKLSTEEEKILINILLNESTVKIVEKKAKNIKKEILNNNSNNFNNNNFNSNNFNNSNFNNINTDNLEISELSLSNLDNINDSNNNNSKSFKNFKPFKNKSKNKTKNNNNFNKTFSNLDNIIDTTFDKFNNNNFNNIKNITHFHKGNIRSGQTIEFNGTLIIIGDINPGGKLVASGNIIVLGKLRGIVHAGCNGDSSCFVSALHLHPAQLFIAETLTYFPTTLKRDIVPEYAYLKNGKMHIEQL